VNEKCLSLEFVLQTAQNFDAKKMLYNSEEKQRGADGVKIYATQQTAIIQYAWPDGYCLMACAEKLLNAKQLKKNPKKT